MNVENRLLIKDCIEKLGKDTSALSRLFYRELFRLDPALRSVFPGNVIFLNRKFANMLGAFRNVKHLEKINRSLEKMGERHVLHYGVQILYFSSVKQALLAALAEYLGEEQFNPALRQAWDTVYDEVTEIMKQAISQADLEKIKRKPYHEADYDPNLLADIGGVETVRRIHQRFYDVMFDEPWLGQFFEGKPKEMLVEKQTQFMVAAFGGPNEYRGDTPAFVHMHMFITDEQADLREKILRKAILDEGLSAAIADRWLSVDHAFRPGIVKKSEEECVLKCFGQVPLAAKKPERYQPPVFDAN